LPFLPDAVISHGKTPTLSAANNSQENSHKIIRSKATALKRIHTINPRAVIQRLGGELYSRNTTYKKMKPCSPKNRFLEVYHAENSNIMRNFASASHWLHDILE